MPYDEIISNEHAAGRIEQGILLMKAIFVMSIVLLLLLSPLEKSLLADRATVMVLFSPTVYLGLVGIPSLRDVKENPDRIVETMFSYYNVVPFLIVLAFFFPLRMADVGFLPEPIAGAVLLIVPVLLSHLYYRLVRRIAEKGLPFALLMLAPTISTALTFPPILAYLPAFLPPYLIKVGLDHLRETRTEFDIF